MAIRYQVLKVDVAKRTLLFARTYYVKTIFIVNFQSEKNYCHFFFLFAHSFIYLSGYQWNWFPLKVCLLLMKLLSDSNKWWFWFGCMHIANGLTFSLISLIFMRVSHHSAPLESSPKDGIKSKRRKLTLCIR